MNRRKKFLIAGSLSAVALAALAAFGLVMATGAEGGSIARGVKRTIYMSAVEYKGGVNVAVEPYPATPPPPGGSYILKPPDATGRWETSTYRWEPGTIVVNRGDEVELWIWGVNGALHDSEIEGYVPSFTVSRGQLTILNFKATKAGTFRIICNTHRPSMEALLVVQPFVSASGR